MGQVGADPPQSRTGAYLKFERALLGGGALDGARILEESTVDAAFTNQIGDLDVRRSSARAGIAGGIYTQFLPFVTPEAIKMYQDFETALYASR